MLDVIPIQAVRVVKFIMAGKINVRILQAVKILPYSSIEGKE